MNNSEQKTCQNCNSEFTIEPDDKTFYEKIGVPPPTWCPQCRRQRRMAWRNDLTFYSRTCDMCDKRIVSLYSPDKPYTVYCQKCWWSDDWDPTAYGRDFDFDRPFFEQFRELVDDVPLMAMVNDDGVGSVNCEYTQNVSFAKNCYMGAMSWKNEDCYYYLHLAGPNTKDVIDSTDLFYNSQTIYDSIFLEHCYRCRNCYYSENLMNCSFCYDCHGCTDCFMSFGLRNKQYHFKNEPYSKEEYEKIVADYRLNTWSGTQRAKAEFYEFVKQWPHRFAVIRNCVNSTGDAIFNCKNAKDTFTARACEDVRFFESGNEVKDSYDLCTGGEAEQCYEALTADRGRRMLFGIFTWGSQETTYTQDCHSCENLFGCASMKNNRYCILNKQYSKEEYHELKNKIIEHMNEMPYISQIANGKSQIEYKYGEFFPIELSNFGYNESMAQLYYPLTKTEAKARGYRWQDEVQFTTGKETIAPEDLPDAIGDVEDSIKKEILACTSCGRNYRIIPDELTFYRKVGIPLPRQCFFCRNKERLEFRHPYKLHRRTCDCAGEVGKSPRANGTSYANTAEHIHGGEPCENEFMTPYSPESDYIVYCESCYKSEVV